MVLVNLYARFFNIFGLTLLFTFFLLLEISFIGNFEKFWTFSTNDNKNYKMAEKLEVNDNYLEYYKVVDSFQSEQSNIAFLKIGKCGSSTTACLLLRYGFRNKLSMYLPRQTAVTESKQKYLIDKNYTCNIFAIHTNYSYHFFSQIVKHPIIIGQIREPERRLVSHAFFFLRKRKDLQHLWKQIFVNEVANNSRKYMARNVMSKFFGIPEKVNSKSKEFNEILKKLDNEFHLVLVLERYDESLILLKRLLKWKIGDIIYNKKKDRSLTTRDIQLDKYSRQMFQQTNKKDYVLYDFFAKKLNKQINAAGKDFNDEVLHFKKVSKTANTFCLKSNLTKYLLFHPSKWDDAFILSKKDCIKITRMDVHNFKRRKFTYV